MLQLFNVSWSDVIQKMPEIAEAGYTSLWLPPPTKAGSGYSIGYDVFDPFDLGDKNQRGTIATHWGTKAQLQQLVLVAHRFGLRVYFDNITNHRGFDVPGYNSSTATNLYPGMVPADFHLQTVSGGYYQNWPNISDWNNVWQVQNQPLSGLLDIANEPGTVNDNFGASLGNTIIKPVFIRQPGSNSYYMDTTLPSIGGPWHPFNGAHGVPVAEDVNTYEIRAVLYQLNETKCDGFRLDAVKHVPSGFFGDTADSPNGYLGAIQTMFDYVHGYGTNVTGNGYVEADDNRNSLFDTEAPRNDAMLFGEHLGEPPSYQEYISRGMRLLNVPLENYLAGVLGNSSASLSGLDGRDFVAPNSDGFSSTQGVQVSQSHDYANSYQPVVELQDAYDLMHEGLPEVYSDGWNLSTASSGQSPFPANAFTSYLGEFGDERIPELAYLHHQTARGGTRSRWSDTDIVAFERYDYRDVASATAYTNPDATTALFVLNDNFGYPGDASFDDGVTRTSDGYYGCGQGSNVRHLALAVGFPPGSVLSRLSSQAPGSSRACAKLLVHNATSNLSQAQATANDPNPVNRLLYVGGQTLAPGGGAIELTIPSGGWVVYGLQWPEASRASLKDAVVLQQGGSDAARVTIYRHDGANGDTNFNPVFPFKMRGSIDPNGNVIGGTHVSNLTYAIDIPVLTNAPFDIAVRCDASATNALLKMDGGLDLNSQMALGPVSGLDRRDNRPGYATDVYLGYEQSALQFRNGPEKFAARLVSRNNVTSLGAETYYYTVGGGQSVVNGSGNGSALSTQTASWIYHDPTAPATVSGGGPAVQMNPSNPSGTQSVDIWFKVGYALQVDSAFIYFTTDGTNPEGSFGTGKGTTRVVPAYWINHDASDVTIDWWKGTLPAANAGTQVRYKVAVFKASGVPAIADSDSSKLYGLAQFGVTNFNPVTSTVWLHDDLNTNNTTAGLATGFHIIRARCFLPRTGKSAVYNTFLQTFYYDGALPSGVVAYPAADGNSLTSSSYTVVVRADSNVTGVDFNIADSNPANDDAATGQVSGNGLGTNGQPSFSSAQAVTPDATLSQQYPPLPQEFRFTYNSIPSSGTATFTIRLKEFSTSVYTNRFTTLLRTVNTLAPGQVVHIGSPANDGSVLVLNSNQTVTLQTCFSPALTTNDPTGFSIYINGVFQPRSLYTFRPTGSLAACPGMRGLLYNWTNAVPGTNVIQVLFTNGVYLGDTRTVQVGIRGSTLDSDGDGMPDWMELVAGTDPHDAHSALRITSLRDGHQLVVWDSVSNVNYQVLATTNLLQPFSVISPVIPASGPSTFFSDPALDPTNKFYRIQVVP